MVLLAPKAHLTTINGLYQERLADENEPYLTFRYNVLRVWERPASVFLEGEIGLLPLSPLAAVTEEELPGVVGRMQERLRSHEQTLAAELWTATDVLMGLRWTRTVVNRLLERVMDLENESWTYQAIMQKGALRDRRRMLLLLGAKQFGPPEPAIKATIEAITDFDRLEQLILRVSDVNSWQELLA